MLMHLSTKGQVTIPQAIREQLGLTVGSGVDIEVCDGVVVLRPVHSERPSPLASAFIERLRGSATVRLTTDEIMAMTRGDN